MYTIRKEKQNIKKITLFTFRKEKIGKKRVKKDDLFEQKRKERNLRREDLPGMEKVLFDVLGYKEIMEPDFLIGRMESILGRHIGVEEFTSCMLDLQMRGLAAEVGSGHYKGVG